MKLQIMSPISERYPGRCHVVTVDVGDSPEEAFERLNQQLAELEWNDGVPCYAATPAKVERILKGTRREPQEIIMVMQPAFGLATVEKIAVNAVMAGCGPEHMPLLIAAVQALAQPQSDHFGMLVSSHVEAPMLLVNGPVAKMAGIYADVCAMGPGVVNTANTAVGKAFRLCLANIAQSKPAEADPNFIGLPSKFGMVIAENEEASPWDPYHVDLGYKREDSLVTLVAVTGPLDIGAGNSPEAFLDIIGGCMDYRYSRAGAWVRGRAKVQVGNTGKEVEYQGPYNPVLFSPSLAMMLSNAGYNRKKAQEYLHNKVRGPSTTFPALESPDQYVLFPTGGSASRGNFFFGVYGIAHQLVEE